jgi:two-component system, NarL family, nitrate/nitrite response regulator NarL
MTNPDKSKNPIYILIADDHVVVRAGLRMLIESQPAMQVVGEATNKEEVMALASREQPDIILLDLHLGSENALDFLSELMGKAEDARIIILTGFRDREEHQRAVRLGAMGVVLKDTTPQLMLKSIERVHAGEVWLDRFLTSKLIVSLRGNEKKKDAPQDDKSVIGKLTDREHEVIALVGEGLKNKQIADRLCISEVTVRHHLTSIFEKLKVSDRLELLIFAYQKGLVKVSA